VLLGIHGDDDGSLGWVINGPSIAPAETIIRATELVGGTDRLPAGFARAARRGGPVAPESVWILYDRRGGVDDLPGSIVIGDEIAVTATAEALKILLAGDGPPNFHLLVGYAGWGAGQLAREIADGAWLPAAAKAPVLFEDELGTLWKRAYADAIGTVPGAFVSTTRGSA
jgi:putative transcriptional regulator